jgi:hypothetical protein
MTPNPRPDGDPSPPQRSWRWMWPGWIRRRGPVRVEAGSPRVKQPSRASSRTSQDVVGQRWRQVPKGDRDRMLAGEWATAG